MLPYSLFSGWQNRLLFSLHFSSSRNLFILGDFNCHHLLWDSRDISDARERKVFNWVISSDLLFLNDHDIPILLHRSSSSLSYPDISFAPYSLALSCSWEMLQDLGSDHLPNLLSVPLFPAFCPNERPPSFNFQKARWDDLAFRRGILVSFSFLCCCFLYFFGTECGQIFHSFRPHQTPSKSLVVR